MSGPPPRKVLIYSINYAPELIGVGRYSGEIGAHLAASGCSVKVVAAPPHYPGWTVKRPFKARRWSRDQQDGVDVHRCPILLRTKMGGIWRLLAPLSFAISSAPVVVWKIFRERPDVVLCVEPTLFAAPAAVLASRLVGARAVLHVQDLEIDAAFAVGHLKGGPLEALGRGFEKMARAGFHHIVTISSQMKSRLADKGIAAERMSIVRNWVDLDRIHHKPGHNSFREELGISEDTTVALYAGNVGRKQALPVMLDAAARLADDRRILFVVAGEGPEKMHLLARYAHLPNVKFLPLQPEERLCDLLNLADLHVLPQDARAADLVLPSKLGGMLASGRSVLVTADAGTELHDFLQDAAILVPAGDSEALAAAIRDFASGERVPCGIQQKDRAQSLARHVCLSAFEAVLHQHHGEKARRRRRARAS